MYVTVRFGEGQEAIFNPNCKNVALLRSIRDRCLRLEEDVETLCAEIELSDESGNIKFLRDSPMRYANEILNDREILVLLRVEKHEGTLASYTPLLKDEEAITEEFLSRLCVRDETDGRPESRRVKSNMRRSPGEKDKDGRHRKTDRSKNHIKPEKVTRSRSRQGSRQ
ncbi:hypothetical protein BaRGS_00036010 [Batillaria attramentaria]|uniref:Uncharacterized protein n=1 Tax=Batillaria attramentaria TaxID=370345 RepID=A0ABD0JCK0_9CAEN